MMRRRLPELACTPTFRRRTIRRSTLMPLGYGRAVPIVCRFATARFPPGWQHREPRRVAQSRLDNCFTGWGGSAEIDAGPASLRIEASAVFR
jgi:hypothetical protein